MAGVEFCPSCRKVLLPDLERRRLACRACGYERPLAEARLFTGRVLKPKPTLLLEGSRRIVKKQCPECRSVGAHSWGQGRSKENAPEPSNTFYRCTRCGHTWKEI